MSRSHHSIGLALIAACLVSVSVAAQTATPARPAATPAAQPPQATRPADQTPTVPALDAMHEVIMPMWHDAWPNKDYKALAGMLPAIEKHVAEIEKAPLPGILRDKAPLWATELDALKRTAGTYKAAVASGKNDDLLKAAEAVHMQYEKLVRVVKPVLPEIDAFHGVLYVMYHTQTSPLAVAKLTISTASLKEKMTALNGAVLPDRLKAKTVAFTTQRDRLSKAVAALSAALDSKNDATIRETVETLHAEYQKLEKVFE
jgi:hypothetical protein